MPKGKRASSRAPLSDWDAGLGPSQPEHPEEERFAELLKPIKDLTANWEVPLSRYLEEYIEELGDLSRMGHLEAKVNFVEAALLLQGTASVYSKKVEFLWQNVLKMLDLLASQKALEGDQGGCQGDKPAKKNRKGPYHDFNDFRAIVIELSRNTIMKGDNNDTHKEHKDRKMALNFISVTPRQLIEKESRDQKGHVRVNIYGTTAGSASASARGIFNDLIGHKEDFRVNAQFSMTSATIGEDLEADSDELAQHSVSLCEEELLAEAAAETSLLGHEPVVFSPPRCNTADQHQNAGEPPGGEEVPEDEMDEPCDADPPVPVETDEDNNLVVGKDKSAVVDENESIKPATSRRNRFRELMEEPRAPLAEPWEAVKPHEAHTNKLRRAMKKGKTCRAPKELKEKLHIDNNLFKTWRTTAEDRRRKNMRKRGVDSSTQVKVVVPIEEYLMKEISRRRDEKFVKLHEIAPQFRDHALEEEQREKERRRQSLENDRKQGRRVAEESEQDEEGAEHHLGAERDHDDDGFEVYEGGVNFDDTGENDPLGNDADPITFGDGAATNAVTDDLEANADSYEDLVMRRVVAYVQQSQEYLESTDMAKRVSLWHEKIRPRLERVEQRSNFDIHSYGTGVLKALTETPPLCGSEASVVSFTDAVRGKDREEICRNFLSALMLANTYNVEIIPLRESNHNLASGPEEGSSPPSKKRKSRKKRQVTVVGHKGPDSLPMDSFSLKLLSMRRHHEELIDYAAPSEEAHTSPTSIVNGPREDSDSDDEVLLSPPRKLSKKSANVLRTRGRSKVKVG